MAISRARAGALLVSRPATLAHATSSTAVASVVSIAISIESGGDCAILVCSSVRTTSSRLRFVSGYIPARFFAMTDSSVRARAMLTPDLRRPLIVISRKLRFSSGRAFGSFKKRGHIINGA
jgi:hypothetical protein